MQQRRRGIAAMLVIGLLVGSTTLTPAAATAQPAGFGTVAVQKVLVDPSGVPIQVQDLGGFIFLLTPLGGGPTIQMPPTSAAGQTLSFVAPGSYTIAEQPRPGYTSQGFTLASGGTAGNLLVVANQTVTLVATNRVAGTAQIVITKQIVNAGGQLVASASGAGFTFTVTGTNGFTETVQTGANGTVTLPSLATPPGVRYSVTEQVSPGFTFFASSVNTIPVANGQEFPAMAGQAYQVLFQNRTEVSTQGQTDPVALVRGCNNVALSWGVGTPVATASAGVTPAGLVESIWRYDAMQGRFLGFSPNPNAPSDYVTISNRFDAVFICVRQAATLNRPRV